MWRHYLVTAVGVVLSVVGLALSALLSFDVAEKMLFAWRNGLPLPSVWVNDPTRVAAFSFLGVMLGCAGLFIVWLGICQCRDKTANRG